MSCEISNYYKIFVLSLAVFFSTYSHALQQNELYNFSDEENVYLQSGDSAFALVHLEKPISFYSEKYDHIYINTNGILTFVTEFTEYLNQPFPLEYPSIAAFYANIDTTASNATTNIVFSTSHNPQKLGRALRLVQSVFQEAYDFQPTVLYTATWVDVGYYRAKNDLRNTFQVVLLCNEEDTYVQLLYPEGGINWIKAETGDSGLPDVRAQAGFMSEDGRHFTLSQSATDAMQYLSATSNVGTPGVWVYRVGFLGFTENVEEPVKSEDHNVPLYSCAQGGARQCHKNARCVDTEKGFCCECYDGFYGNGYNCLSNTQPIRVSGSISGVINNKNISENVKLQSYVVVTDGRSYTAINPITSDIANELQLALPISGAIGWIFAKQVRQPAKNGYQITGGYMVHSATISFKDHPETLMLKQNFSGLNYWDQLQVDIEVFGDVPYLAPRTKIEIKDFTEEYFYSAHNVIQSYSTPVFELVGEGRTLEATIHQNIEFTSCNRSGSEFSRDPVIQKVSKVNVKFEDERAIRVGMLTKVGVDPHGNPCTDGTAICGENTLCLPREDELYDCVCKPGYAPNSEEDVVEYCTDIDECHGDHICSEFATCENTGGGYNCICQEGYEGNGNTCVRLRQYGTEDHTSSPYDGHYPTHSQTEHYPTSHHEYETTTYPYDPYREEYPTEPPVFQEPEHSTQPPHEHPSTDPYYPPYEHEYDPRYNDTRYGTEGSHEQPNYHHPDQNVYPTESSYPTEHPDYTHYPSEPQPTSHPEYEYTDHPTETQTSHPDYTYRPTEMQTSYQTCSRCAYNAACIQGVCVCPTGYTGDGIYCQQICRENEKWVEDRCVVQYSGHSMYDPYCSSEGECACPTDYEYHPEDHTCKPIENVEYGSGGRLDEASCDVEFNCHENATCEWSGRELRHVCVCPRGYDGDGYTCTKVELSCTMREDICDVNAVCIYVDSIGKSECRCSKGYGGDGFTCHPSPECHLNEHCTANSYCDRGICVCFEGFERDNSEYCVPAGMCGGAFCAANAMCKWDNIQKVQYCECLDGYEGDGVRSCKEVPIPCNVRNNCGLHASCSPSYRHLSTYECICDPGFFGDGFVCMEEKNCRNTPSLCDPNANCITTSAGLQCVCNQNFLGNGTYCKEVTLHEHGFLLISQGVVIIRLPFDGKAGRPVSVAQMAIGLDKDCAEGRVYWGDISAKKISSSKYNGTDTKVFIDEDINSPEGIAVDWISRRIYWTDSSKDTIEVASLDNPRQRAVVVNKNLVNPRGIAVDPHKNKLYWSDWNREAPKIEMSELDGTGREVLLTKPTVVLPNSLVVLDTTGELCYADAGTHKIECLDSYTRQIRTIATNLTYPFGLTSSQDHFYWTDWTTKQIESVDVFGRRKPGIRAPVFGSHKMYGMTAIVDNCPLAYSPCLIDNGGCPADRLCLVNHKAQLSKSCKCTTNSTSCNTPEYLDH